MSLRRRDHIEEGVKRYSHKIKTLGGLILWADKEDAGPYAVSAGYVGPIIATFGEKNISVGRSGTVAQQEAFYMASALLEASSMLFDEKLDYKELRKLVAVIRQTAKTWGVSQISKPGFVRDVVSRMEKKMKKTQEDTVSLRRRDYLGEAKKMTFDQAKNTILDWLEKNGWTVNRGLKIPHATKDGVKLWFKTQAVYASDARQAFGEARSMWTDMKMLANPKNSPQKVSDYLYKEAKRQVDAILRRD